jgi:hypothetical protein
VDEGVCVYEWCFQGHFLRWRCSGGIHPSLSVGNLAVLPPSELPSCPGGSFNIPEWLPQSTLKGSLPPKQSPDQPMAIELGHFSCLFGPFFVFVCPHLCGVAGQFARSRRSTGAPARLRPDENRPFWGTWARAEETGSWGTLLHTLSLPQEQTEFDLRRHLFSFGGVIRNH